MIRSGYPSSRETMDETIAARQNEWGYSLAWQEDRWAMTNVLCCSQVRNTITWREPVNRGHGSAWQNCIVQSISSKSISMNRWSRCEYRKDIFNPHKPFSCFGNDSIMLKVLCSQSRARLSPLACLWFNSLSERCSHCPCLLPKGGRYTIIFSTFSVSGMLSILGCDIGRWVGVQPIAFSIRCINITIEAVG